MRTRISVVTVCRNAEAHLSGCLQSVANQSWPDLEHIIIDGASTDGTLDLVRAFPHVQIMISEPDKGIYDAMNKGLKHVTGDFVLFLNADDRFYASDSVARAVEAIAANPGADVYYGPLEVRTRDGFPHIFHPPPPNEAPEFLVQGCLPHQSTLARPSVFERTGPFDLRFRCHADYDWFLKIFIDPSISVKVLDVVIGSFLEGGVSSQLEKGQAEVFQIQNASPLYAGTEWDKKRIEILQAAWLQARLSAQKSAPERGDTNVPPIQPIVNSVVQQTDVPENIVKLFERLIGKSIERRYRRLRDYYFRKVVG